MEQELHTRLQKLMNHILDVKEQISALAEQQNYSTKEAATCRQAVDDVGTEYQAILDAAPAGERDQVDRRYGRQVIDLRRFASWLPVKTHGEAVPLAKGDQWSWATDEFSPSAQRHTPAPQRLPAPTGPHVGGEIEAWCGSCKELRMHTIVAMVNQEPKQVICLSCDAKHGFRMTPARGKKSATSTSKRRKGKLTNEEQKRLREEEERTAFQKELTDAAEVRPFSKETRIRWRAGQIIEHPDHGRGKIESVVKGSLLVRFRSGRRPISLY